MLYSVAGNVPRWDSATGHCQDLWLLLLLENLKCKGVNFMMDFVKNRDFDLGEQQWPLL